MEYGDASRLGPPQLEAEGVDVGVPDWAIWVFIGCAFLIVAVLLLDYFVIRRNALGNTCCGRGSKQKRANANAGSQAHQKRSTNMLLNKMSRIAYDVDA